MNTSARLERLCDAGSFRDLATGRGGCRTGVATIGGRPAVVIATETDLAGNVDPVDSLAQHLQALECAASRRVPVVVLLDGRTSILSGHQLAADPTLLLAGPRSVGHLYSLHARLAGEVPQIGVLCGPVSASLSFLVPLCDFAIFVEGATLAIGTPAMVRAMTGEETTAEAMGGAKLHCAEIGTGDFLASSDEEAIAFARACLELLPSRRGAPSPVTAAAPPERALADDAAAALPMREFVRALIDAGSLLELQARHAPELITAFAKIEGKTIGLAANDARHRGGLFFPETCRKLARFVERCDDFGVPLAFLADAPGFMIGTKVERQGIVAAGAQLFRTLARCTTRRYLAVVRRALTAGLYAMNGPGFGAEEFVALPGAAISIFAPGFMERLADDPTIPDEGRTGYARMAAEARDPRRLRDRGLLDAVVAPSELRGRLAAFLAGECAARRASQP